MVAVGSLGHAGRRAASTRLRRAGLAAHHRRGRFADVPTTDRALAVALGISSMPAVVLSEFRAGQQHVIAGAGTYADLHIHVGQALRLEGSYCQRVIDGRLDALVPDTGIDPGTVALASVPHAAVRSFLSVPVRFGDGRLFGALCCMDGRARPDVAPRVVDVLADLAALLAEHLEGERAEAAADRERDNLLESVTHDLRTPLMGLRFLGEDLVAGSASAREAGEQVVRESGRVLTMVEDILLVTRQRAGTAVLQATPTDLSALAREAVDRAEQSAESDGHPIVLRVPAAGGPVAPVDANRVLRAPQDLIDNARRYSPGGGRVDVELREDGSTALFSVRDEGIGIAAEDLPRLTDRFFRSERAVEAGIVGTGLGLTTVQAVADMHEGTLHVESALGEGSTFRLRLPCAPVGRSA